VGLNPINNVVDITNFVQHEVGQPLHAFDADKIDGEKVIIKNLSAGSKFITLDSVERSLTERDLMICNPKEGMCIAGVFGGIKSGVSGSTKNIFLESAYFNPVAIRKTSKRHGLKTDASFRFERGADPNITLWALKRAIMLIKEIAGGEISSDIVDVYPKPFENAQIDIFYKNINRLIGKKIEPVTVKKILSLLDIDIIKEEEETLKLSIPSYRVDVKQEADVIEEILRIYGYNNVEVDMHVNSTLSYPEKPDKEKVKNIISDHLSANGFAEIMCNSLCPSTWYLQSDDFDKDQLVILANPLSSDLNAMRQTLLFGGLSSVSWNINRQNPDIKLYEFGNCYFYHKTERPYPKVENYTEKTSLDLFISGNTGRQSWNSKTNPSDFFHIKSSVEMILTRLGVKTEDITTVESDKKYYSESVTWLYKNALLAHAGKISKSYLSKFDIGQDVYWGHIEWDMLMKILKTHEIKFHELPKYPAVRRDLALLLDRSIKFARIRDISFKTERNLLKDINLFDVYENDNLGNNKKSYAVSFTLRDDLKTMTDKNIDKIMNNLIRAFETELGAQIR
jgi:phenylalanyl-tRNA synthetase beta chain